MGDFILCMGVGRKMLVAGRKPAKASYKGYD